MFYRDCYRLGSSSIFDITTTEEVKVNLALQKQPKPYHTLLKGRVCYKDKPLKNAVVKVFDLDHNPLVHTFTNEYGYYKFKNILKPGSYYVLASHKYYSTSETRYLTLGKYDIKVLRFSLKKNPVLYKGVLYGVVKDAYSRKIIKNVKITLLSKHKSKLYARTFTNNLGQYILYNLPAGEYSLIAEHHGFQKYITCNINLYNHEKTKLNFHLIPDSQMIDGTISGIINHKNTPLENASIFLCNSLEDNNFDIEKVQISNEQGAYLIPHVSTGEYTVKAKMQEEYPLDDEELEKYRKQIAEVSPSHSDTNEDKDEERKNKPKNQNKW